MDWILRRTILVMSAGLLAGCGASEVSVPQALPEVVTPTHVALTPTLVPSAMPLPTTSPTLRTRPTPTFTPAPQAEVVLTLADCDWTFGDPFLRERRLLDVLEEPGIMEVVSLRENEVRLVYDPTQLTQEETVRAFERASGFETGGETTPSCP